MSAQWSKRDGLIALHQIQGVGWHTLDQLLQAGWDPGVPLENYTKVFDQIPWRRKDLPDKIRQKWTARFILKVREELLSRQIQALTVWDDDYPELLRELPQPPWILYLKGNGSLVKGTCLAVVGTRKPTSYGKKATGMLIKETISQGWTIVSGMATGIDGEAHRAVLNDGGKTIAVLGCGVDVIYPKHHRLLYERIVKEGLVLSEMPPGTKPHPGLFPQRNRIISGLSHGVLLIEAAERSGSLITADCAIEQGRDVFAIPGPITSEQSIGTNRLIQQGAKCILSGKDILEEFPHLPGLSSQDEEDRIDEELLKEEQTLLQHLTDQPLHFEEISTRSGISIGELYRLLLTLQVKGKVRQLPGGRYEKG
ncbi:DNA processing protein [Marininema mesophilum]|uniref:DNA processing protein n=1 Tax=Marininema mesophilum TaxID=1048340 RepID=A0A1H2U780_9BACL|nr:DNA-processing protein DprA [Marininema mesophilum]SDW51920.1 DNA processing protein [Marininema mesophilum]